MNVENQELMFDLLAKKAIYGLDDAEQGELDGIDPAADEREFRSLEITAAAISLAGASWDEQIPAHLQARILDQAEQIFARPEITSPWPPSTDHLATAEPAGWSLPNWLGWAVAAAASIALAVNMWFTRSQNPPQAVVVQPPVIEKPKVLTPAEMREEFMRSVPTMVKANWASGNVKEMKDIAGDVVWSDEKQAGYMRFRGLPANNTGRETYQLWIFDKTQDKATPIDGGTFNVSADGEVVIPINAKLKASGAEMFAITIEKPGGVVVSKREKIAALAKVETPAA